MKDFVRAAAVIEQEGKFLLVQEATPVVYGLWNWQQGKVDEGESPEDAAVREAKEETGLDVRVVRKLGVIEHPFLNTKEIHVFLTEAVGGELKVLEGEILQVKWFTLEELEEIKDKTPGPWVFDTIGSI